MIDTVFREYDIRGKVGSDLNLNEVHALVKAIAYYFVQENPEVKTVAVGMDGRTHSPAIKELVCDALVASGLDVVFIGMCTSPVLYFSLFNLKVDAGLMITASHNPKEYNGLKICLGKDSVWGVQIKEICALFKQRKSFRARVEGMYREHNMIAPYVDWLVRNFPHLMGMDLSVVIDCGNGAAGTVLPSLIKKMHWSKVNMLYAEVDGTYPNHEADPVVEKNMLDVKEILATTPTQLGIGLDGDCDRMVPMTKKGYLVPGDKLLALFSKYVLQENPGAGIVFDVKSSAALVELLENWKAKPYMAPSGHSIIKTYMKKHNALLGGELSCHFFFSDRYFGYDDGIYAAMRLIEILVANKSTLEDEISMFPQKCSSPEYRLKCSEEQKSKIVERVKGLFAQRTDVTMITIDGVRASMPYGWGIVRASNTNPEICLRFESDSESGLHSVKQDFLSAMQPFFSAAVLQMVK